MKAFDLKRIIGMAIDLTALIIWGGGAEVAAQIQPPVYPALPPANGGYACVGDTILITATADDLIVPSGDYWSGDATNANISTTPGVVTKRFFTYHPYLEADPTVLKARDFEFSTVKNGTTQKHTVSISAKSCPPKQLNTSKVTVTSFGEPSKYNLGNINFDYAFENQTSREIDIRVVPAFNPAQPFCPLGKNGTHLSRSNQNQVNASYRAIQIANANYTVEAFYNEGDSCNRKTIINHGDFNLTDPLGTLQPDQTGYCPGSTIVFSLQLGTTWQNVLKQTVNDDESKLGSCFNWSGSPTEVSFTRRDGDKYFFTTTADGTSSGQYRCEMTVLIKYANAKNNPKIDTSFTHTYDVPVVQPTYNTAKGFTKHDETVCNGAAIDLTSLLPGVTVAGYRTKSGTPIPQAGSYQPTQSDVVYADISAPCVWTDSLRVNVIDQSEVYSITPSNTLLCAGETLSFSATANGPIGWTILYPNNSAANESWTDTESGKVHTRTFTDNAKVVAAVSVCGTSSKRFEVQVVTPPDNLKLVPAEKSACPYTPVSLSGAPGWADPSYTLYDLNADKDITDEMRDFISPTDGLTDYPMRPNDHLRLTYKAGTNFTADGYTPNSLTCYSTADALITAYPLPPVSISYQGDAYPDNGTACVPRDKEFTLTASGADTYEWVDAPALPTSPNRDLTLAGDYTVRVRGVENTHRCFDTLTLNCVVSVDKADRVKTAAVCPGTEVCFQAYADDKDLPGTTYTWIGPDGNPVGNTTAKYCHTPPRGQAAGPYPYTLETQRSICKESLDYILTVHPAPVIELQANTINPDPNATLGYLCVGDDLTFNYRITGLPETEALGYEFTKDGEHDPVADGHPAINDPFLFLYSKPNVQLADAGTYVLTVKSINNQCSDTHIKVVEVDEPVDVRITLDADTACEADGGRLTAELSSPDNGFFYQWFINNHRVGGDNASLALNWERNDHDIHLEVQQRVCKSEADAVVAVVPRPVLGGMQAEADICQGEDICLSTTSDITPNEIIWYWINNSGRQSQTPRPDLTYPLENADESMNGRYFVEAVSQAGTKRCASFSDTTRLTVRPTPDLRIDGPTFICDGSTVTLTAHSRLAETYRWRPNNATEATISITEAGTYEVTVTSAYGCRDSADITLEARPLPYFSLPPDTSICRGTSIMIYGPDGMDAYYWNDGSQDKDILAQDGGWYILTVFRNECPYSDSLYVHQSFCGQFHFPTAFTPNDNRVNDTWGAISAAKDEDMAEYDLMVFDRNGKKVFHGKRISDQWDGMCGGRLCPPGVYTFSFRALEKLEGIKYQANGTVTIVQ